MSKHRIVARRTNQLCRAQRATILEHDPGSDQRVTSHERRGVPAHEHIDLRLGQRTMEIVEQRRGQHDIPSLRS